MRKEFIQTNSRFTANNKAPWASIVTKVNGGFIAFESRDDFKIWKNQK